WRRVCAEAQPRRTGDEITLLASGPPGPEPVRGGDSMLREEKETIVAELAERLRQTQTLIVADYRGLTMKEIDALRTRLLEHGACFTVVKNTLTRRAAEVAGADTVLALLEGPTAIAFLEAEGDPVAVAKALADAAREARVLEI